MDLFDMFDNYEDSGDACFEDAYDYSDYLDDYEEVDYGGDYEEYDYRDELYEEYKDRLKTALASASGQSNMAGIKVDKTSEKDRKRKISSKTKQTKRGKNSVVTTSLDPQKKCKTRQTGGDQNAAKTYRTATKTTGPKSSHRRSKVDLLGALRKFSANKVKIPKDRMQWARSMADTHLESIRKHCQANSGKIFSHFEYTGSFYEHLKTEDADELDIIVALDTKDNAHLEVEEVVPGYARIKVTKTTSKYSGRFVNNEGYLRPKKIRSWFFSLVQKAVNEYKSKKGKNDPELKPSDNGPATKLVVYDKETKKKLSIDLVPAFLFKQKGEKAEERHYVAKNLPDEMITETLPCTKEMLWRQSFSLEEKRKMANLDKDDQGCRREVVKIIKTIRMHDPTLAKLSSYHIKTAFLHYNFDEGQEKLDWAGKALPERFVELLKYLRQKVEEQKLTHFFIQDLDLLKELNQTTLDNIHGRLATLTDNDSAIRRVLYVTSESTNTSTPQNASVKAKKIKLHK